MDKGLLFQFMRVKFREAGFPPAEVDLHVQSFAERYQNQTDEEIEADIRRRGGPTRIAATVIERRNTVLMADADYRAFVETAKETAAQSATEEDADVKETVIEVPTEEAAETVTKEPAQNKTDGDTQDPLAAWFAGVENKPPVEKTEDETVPPLFTEDASETSVETDSNAATAEIQPVKQKPDTAADATAEPVPKAPQASVQPARQAVQAPIHRNTVNPHAQQQPNPVQPMRQMPQKPSAAPRPAADADMGSTKVLQMPTAQPNPAAPQKQPPVSETYQKEQAAIWSASTGVRDGKGTPNRPPVQSVPQTSPTRSQPVQHPAQAAQRKAAGTKIEYADRGTVTRLQEKTYWGEGSEEGVKRFRIIFGLSIPFVTVLLLIYAAAAVALIAVMAALIAVFVVGLVAEVAVGSLIALIAVIYGISQLFLVLPVGMFELGLGVAAIGVTMFVGILTYNIAVRLLPFLLRSFISFQSVFKGFLQDLYYYVKGECYRR